MKIKTILLFILIPFIFCYSQKNSSDNSWPTLANTPWPMIKHDPQFTGRSPFKGPQTPNIIWTADLKDGIFSGPVIDKDGNLLFGSYYQFNGADYFYCYSPDGELLWDYQTHSNRPPQSGILIDSSNTIYFGSLDKNFYALYPDGTLKWKYETSAPIVELAIPNIDLNGNLYITNGLGELYSIKPDGTLNWNVKYEGGFFQNSPVFSPDGNTIYIAGKDSNLFALNLDGSIKWKFSCKKIMLAPLIDDLNNIYFIPYQAPLSLFSINQSGIINWTFLMRNEYALDMWSIPTLDFQRNIYFINVDTIETTKWVLTSISNQGKFRWKYIFQEDESMGFTQPLISDSEGTIYIGSTTGMYYYAISSNGELKWKIPLDGYQVDNTSAIAEDGTLYIGIHKSSLATNQQRTLIAIRDSTSTGVQDPSRVLNYKLEQNFPNPFNPTTTIKYALPEESNVELKIYDIMGKEIRTLISGNNQAGYKEVYWDGTNDAGIQVSSGIYLYRLVAKSLEDGRRFEKSAKMIMMK